MHADPDQEMQWQHQFARRTSLATHWICLKTQLTEHNSCRQKLIAQLQESPPSFILLGLVFLGQKSQTRSAVNGGEFVVMPLQHFTFDKKPDIRLVVYGHTVYKIKVTCRQSSNR